MIWLKMRAIVTRGIPRLVRVGVKSWSLNPLWTTRNYRGGSPCANVHIGFLIAAVRAVPCGAAQVTTKARLGCRGSGIRDTNSYGATEIIVFRYA